ncbi:membrane protein [Neorhizobium sp. NCHU2750]|nr:membrane protein [Neorhizobium sp. NCHU2750]
MRFLGRKTLQEQFMTPRSQGLIFALTAVSIFAIQDGISKHLGQAYPAVFVAMIRYWFFAAFVLALASRNTGGIRQTAKSTRLLLQIVRGALLVAQIVVSIYSFSHVGLAQTHTIFAATPLVVACLSVPLLGETVGWRRWLAIGVGFLGILLIIDPTHASFGANMLIPITCTIMFAFYSVFTRMVSRTDTSQTSFFYTGIAGAAAVTLVGPFYWTSIAPNYWFWMAALCVTGMSGHYLLIRAFDLLDAVVVQPIFYWQTVLVCIIGTFIFGEVMTWNMIAGCVVVIGAGLFTILREAQLGKQRPPVEPPGAL